MAALAHTAGTPPSVVPLRIAPLRIALVHQRHATVGGTERFLNALAAYLAERGHEVVIVCRRREGAPHAKVHFKLLHGFALGTSWRLWRFARDVERHLARTPYDLVFGLGKTATQDVIRAGGGCHETYVELAHRWVKQPWELGLGLGRLKNRLAIALERRAYAPGRYRHVIAISEMVKRDIIARHGVPEQSIAVIHNGVDLRRFNPARRGGTGAALRESLGWGPQHTVLLFLGRGFGRKGLDRLLVAFARITAARPQARLLVVGRDHGRPAYERQASALGLRDTVRFIGEREDPEVCYGAADLYVLPARYDPFAFSVLEALATGLPVIATDRTGASELIDDAVGSVVTADGSADELADALLRWTEPGRIEHATAAARARAERHPFEDTLSATEAVLLAAAEAGSAPAGARATASPAGPAAT